MRGKYSIAIFAIGLAVRAAFAAPCPAALIRVGERVAALRAVPAPFVPPCRVITYSALRGELDRKLRRDLPLPPGLFLETLIRLGLADGEPNDLYQRLLTFYSSQVLGFYEPATDEMVLLDNPPLGEAQVTLVWAHELAHAAQEHKFHLPSHLLAMRADGDAQRAASAIAEGEAMLVMFEVSAPQGAGTDPLAAAEDLVKHEAIAMARPTGVPEYFVQDLIFPYLKGFAAVAQAFRRGGWPSVDALLARPPSSSAALLHPERPARATPSDDRDMPAVPAGWEEVLTDTFGEWGLRFVLSRGLPDGRAEALAASWAGDRLRVIRKRGDHDRWALAWRVRCASQPEREQLEQALRSGLPALFAHLAGKGRFTTFAWSSRGSWLEVTAAWPQVSPDPSREPLPPPQRPHT